MNGVMYFPQLVDQELIGLAGPVGNVSVVGIGALSSFDTVVWVTRRAMAQTFSPV